MGVHIPSWEGTMWGKGTTHCKVWGRAGVHHAKMAEPMEMPFGMLSPIDPRNHVLDGV